MSYPIKSKKILYYSDSTFTRKLLKPTHVPTQEPYYPNNVFSATNEDKVSKEENNALAGPSAADYPFEARTEDAVYDESGVNDELKEEDLDDEYVDDKFEDEEDDGFNDEEDEFESGDEFKEEIDDDGFDDEEDEFEGDDKFKAERHNDGFDDEEDEFDDEDIDDELKNDNKAEDKG
jgi:type IV secretion system protein VirD4